MKRSGKFYRKNESEVMKDLGLEPTPNSGSGWIVKEDGQNDNIICQLKSTDTNSIKVNKLDIDKLLHNAAVEHKIPVFAVQFLKSNEVYLIVRPQDLKDVGTYLKTGEIDNSLYELDLAKENKSSVVRTKKIKSSSNARELFNIENEKKFKKQRRSAK